ncbi:MAG: CRISPR-associated endonuclease Cas2 [Erysipelotrichaceae bacterium]|jgi:CRISPR-associated protein Cas2|nr:CRISPR-associated endonuclease Cas2 [Erysipelotrichaceae bacterium]
MRTILFFDLPSVSKTDHREYTRFVKFIKKKGFVMLQESVYTKLSINESVVDSTMGEIKKALPKDGMISVLTITEKQFASIEHILGDMNIDVVVDDAKVVKL